MSTLPPRLVIPVPGGLVSRLAVMLALAALLAAYPYAAPPPASPTSPTIAPGFGVLPLSFIPNAGQTDPAVHFQAHGLGGTLFFTPDQVVLSLPPQERVFAAGPVSLPSHTSTVYHPWSVVRLRFEDASPAPQITGAGRLPGIANYFIGDDPAGWRTELPTYARIVYRDLYPGIDLHYAGTSQAGNGLLSLKGTYTLAPGADPARIRWRYEGATSVNLDGATSNLVIELPTTPPSRLVEHAPHAWQDIGGRRVPVDVHYAIDAYGSIGFVPGNYDPAYPLAIDPMLTYSTYLGGSSYDYAWDIAVDGQGNAYVVGRTGSIDFPTQDPLQGDIGGGPLGDAFVVKLNPAGSALVYATYLGGSHNEAAYGIAVDEAGVAYITGDTLSADFPTLNAAQPVSGGGGPFEGDAFITALDPSGSALVYSTYLGGGGDELSYGITLDAQGDVCVAGYTSSTDFPITNAPQPDPAFGQGLNVYGDAFVTKMIEASGVYTWGLSTYLGGSDLDIARDIAAGASGALYVTGHTRSADFPTANAPQPAYAGGSNFGSGDAFVTQIISASGVYTWGYATYLGGTGDEAGNGIAVDGSEAVYVTGETSSSNFPTVDPFQATYAGDQDAFVTRVVSAGQGYAWGYSTYLGGEGTDLGQDVAVDASGQVYLTGYSFSPDFPTSDDAYDASCGSDGLCDSSGGDVFLSVLNASGDGLAYSTFLGGSSTDFGTGIARDPAGDVYLSGYSYSADFPTSPHAHDRTCGTDGQCNGFTTDAFLARFTMLPHLWLAKSAQPPAGTPVTQGDTITYTLVAANHGDQATDVLIADSIPAGTAYVPDSLTTTLGSPAFDWSRLTVSLPDLASGVTLTATFQVTVTTSFSTSITNQASLTAAGLEPLESNLVGHPVAGTGEPYRVYLPLVLKGAAGEPPPPPGCAPYLVASIAVGQGPRGVALDTTRNRVYVANYGDGSLSVVETGTNRPLHTITGLTSPNGVAYDPAHDLIWVTNYTSDRVTPIDAASLTPQSSIPVGDGPWGVAYDPIHDYVYVAHSLGDSVAVIDAGTRGVIATLSGDFDQPFHVAASPVTGKAYVPNFGAPSVVVLDGATVSSVVNLGLGDPTTQPYGVAVDELRDLVYVAAVDSHRVAVIGRDAGGTPDQLLGWASFRRGFGDPARPVPLRVIAVNPDIGPPGDGGHLWLTTSTADGSEADQVLLVPKGWDAFFSYPVAYDLDASPSGGIAVDRGADRVYITSGASPGTLTVLGDSSHTCLVPFAAPEGFAWEVFAVQD
ncbi:MAG: hypothetical protein Kow0063_18380 [Anaerolineae bacterium]